MALPDLAEAPPMALPVPPDVVLASDSRGGLSSSSQMPRSAPGHPTPHPRAAEAQ
ncbi:MAG: hypothetical protein IVW57_05085 [Ktedonobacterales bacterium]|nr:hypothetical protein [Ktedonobacterales bacterium]